MTFLYLQVFKSKSNSLQRNSGSLSIYWKQNLIITKKFFSPTDGKCGVFIKSKMQQSAMETDLLRENVGRLKHQLG